MEVSAAGTDGLFDFILNTKAPGWHAHHVDCWTLSPIERVHFCLFAVLSPCHVRGDFQSVHCFVSDRTVFTVLMELF